jgi:hypothetical protein
LGPKTRFGCWAVSRAYIHGRARSIREQKLLSASAGTPNQGFPEVLCRADDTANRERAEAFSPEAQARCLAVAPWTSAHCVCQPKADRSLNVKLLIRALGFVAESSLGFVDRSFQRLDDLARIFIRIFVSVAVCEIADESDLIDGSIHTLISKLHEFRAFVSH